MKYEHVSGDPDNTRFEAARFVPPQNNPYPRGKPKPGTGLWASVADSDDNWRSWLRYNRGARSERSGFQFNLSDAARLLVIHSVCDIEPIPKIVEQDSKHPRVGIDWKQLELDWDAVFVGGKALYTELFYTWDVPSLLVLKAGIVITDTKDQLLDFNTAAY